MAVSCAAVRGDECEVGRESVAISAWRTRWMEVFVGEERAWKAWESVSA